MNRELLLDTGALVSLLDRSQRRHLEFVRFFETWEDKVVSTEAVLTEATHILNRVPGGAVACLDFFLRGGAILVPSSLPALARCRDLMQKYSDLPMDHADATLVVLAEEPGHPRLVSWFRFDVFKVVWGGCSRLEDFCLGEILE